MSLLGRLPKLGATRREVLEIRPASEHTTSQGAATPPKGAQLDPVFTQLRDDAETVENALTGGSGAPSPVFVRNANEMFGCAPMGACDEGVAPDQPASAGIRKVPANIGAGERTPFGAVGRLSLDEQCFRQSDSTKAGGETNSHVGQFG